MLLGLVVPKVPESGADVAALITSQHFVDFVCAMFNLGRKGG